MIYTQYTVYTMVYTLPTGFIGVSISRYDIHTVHSIHYGVYTIYRRVNFSSSTLIQMILIHINIIIYIELLS